MAFGHLDRHGLDGPLAHLVHALGLETGHSRPVSRPYYGFYFKGQSSTGLGSASGPKGHMASRRHRPDWPKSSLVLYSIVLKYGPSQGRENPPFSWLRLLHFGFSLLFYRGLALWASPAWPNGPKAHWAML